MSNTKKEYRKAQKKRFEYKNNYLCQFTELYHNSVLVENGDDIPKRYLLRTLLHKGGIAYDKETGLYLPYSGVGIDVYGLPTMYNLVGQNGLVLMRKADEVVILRANDIKYSMYQYFMQQAERVTDIDMSIDQNLEAIKTMSIAYVDDHKQLLSLINEVECRRIGCTIVFENKKSTVGSGIKCESTGAQYLVDKLLEARRQILDETLSSIGISVANTDKRERVQGMEVRASQGLAKDMISTLIDTFNYDAEQGGLPIRLKANTSLMKEDKIMKEEGEINENTTIVND